MTADIAFCPLCAGKLDAEEDADQFRCVECEAAFLIQRVVGDDDEDEDDDDDDDDEDDVDDDDDDEEEADEEDKY